MDSELDRLDPDVTPLTLSTGLDIEIVRMKTRQFFRLLKVLTHGAGARMLQSGLDFEAEPSVFVTKLSALVAMSVPDAEHETIEFLDSMGQPAGLAGGVYGKSPNELNKQEKERDDSLWVRYHRELFNPDPMDTFTIVEAIVRREAEDVQALGKRFGALMKMAQKMGQDAPGEPDPTPTGNELHQSLAPSPAASTSSATSTGGPTGTSSTSPSADSGKPQKQPATAGAQSS
jgi:hypothetical protein